jgi:8-oxo-dGTP diphosphatase
MPPPYCYEYPRPAVTVDLVVFRLRAAELRVLLVRRKHEPFAGRWAIPGGFVEIDEPIEAAARRELREETGLDVDAAHVEFLGVFGDPGRDPRGRTISMAHIAAVRGPFPNVAGGDDAEKAAWVPVKKAVELAFDHDLILASALNRLDDRVRQGDAALALLPDEFSRRQVVQLFKALESAERSALAWVERMQRGSRIAASTTSGDRFRSVHS